MAFLALFLRRINKNTASNFSHSLARAMALFVAHTKCFCMLVFLSVIENIVVPPFNHLFCCFRPRARCFYSQLKRAGKTFIMPGHYKKIMPTQQPIRAGVLLYPYNKTPYRFLFLIWDTLQMYSFILFLFLSANTASARSSFASAYC